MLKKYMLSRTLLQVCACFLLLFTGFTLEAQYIVSNPNDRLYTYLTLWEEEGLIGPLPLLRPYPLQVVKYLLARVTERGSPADRDEAQAILAVLNDKQGFRLELANTARAGNEGVYDGLQFNLLWRGEFSPLATYALNGGILLGLDSAQALPRYTRPDRDLIADWASLDFNGLHLNVCQSFFGTVGLGNESTFFQAGIVRNSFGPFFENGAVLGPQAPHTGHFSFSHSSDSISLGFLLLALKATDDFGESDFSGGAYPQKFLSLQSVSWYPFSWLELGVFESIVYGETFNPVYLIPLASLLYSQIYYGVKDNSFFGLLASFKLPERVRIKTQLYADDLHFNDLVRFNFDTKYKLSLQTGVTWTPGQEIFKRLSFDYLLITPYMYTHRSYENYQQAGEPNYLNYTHNGLCLGSALEPNSDQFTLASLVKPLSWLELEPFAKWIRHGNASDGYITDGSGTGTIFDAGYEGAHPVFQETTRFLSQDVLEHVFQLGCTGYFNFDFSKMQLSLQAGYVFEVVCNEGLVDGKHAVHNYGKIGIQVNY